MTHNTTQHPGSGGALVEPIIDQARRLAESGAFDAASGLLHDDARAALDPGERALRLLRLGLAERSMRGPTPASESALRGALREAESCGEEDLSALAAMALGELLLESDHDPARVQESIRWHQQAARRFAVQRDRERFALCQINAAVAYLSLPGAGGGPSTLKPKIAVQCLRAALAELDRAEHAPIWESAVLNLANALQQLPPEPEGANLREAVTLYHELLDARADADPAARGRVLANLGCALGKLGCFADALARLDEALTCFADDHDSAAGVRATIEEIRSAAAAAERA